MSNSLIPSIALDSPALIRAAWQENKMLPETILSLQQAGVLRFDFEAMVNMHIDGDLYTGKMQIRGKFVHVTTNEVVYQSEFDDVEPTAEEIHDTAQYGVGRSAAVQQKLKELNGGILPSFRQPRTEN